MDTMTLSQRAIQTLKKGDLFKTSWGYDQTNYDFLVVLEVSKTGKTAKCQMTSALKMGHENQHDILEPIFFPYGDIFTMQVREGYTGDLQLKGSYPFCNNGKMDNSRMDRFTKCSPGDQYHQTDCMSGH
jgi:hypothetical protein